MLTGILYVDSKKRNFAEMLNTVDRPLATLPQEMTRPPKEALDTLMEELR